MKQLTPTFPHSDVHIRGNTITFLSAVFFLSFLLAGCYTTDQMHRDTITQAQAGALLIQQRTDEYIINSGDQIEINVWMYDEFNTERTVSSRGFVSVPLIGEVEARGLTQEEFEASLAEKLSEYIQGDVNLSVSITSSRDNIVSVLGSVGRPDNYELVENSTLFEVLSRAGGMTTEADLRNIQIYRRDSGANNPIKIDLNRFLHGQAHPSTITPIIPGDIVYVHREENIVREMSTFMREVVILFGMFRILN